MSEQVQLGDLVWAKMKRFRPWPGKVIALPGQRSVMRKPSTNKLLYCIGFFGTNDHAWIDETDVKPYAKFKEQYTKGRKSALFQHSCALIEQYVEWNGGAGEMVQVNLLKGNSGQISNFSAQTGSNARTQEKEIPVKKPRGRPRKNPQDKIGKPNSTKSRMPKAPKSAAGAQKQKKDTRRGPGRPPVNRALPISGRADIVAPDLGAGASVAEEMQGQTIGNHQEQEPGWIQIESSFSTRDLPLNPPPAVLSSSSASESTVRAESIFNVSMPRDSPKSVSTYANVQLYGSDAGTLSACGITEQQQLKEEYFRSAFKAIGVLHEVCSQMPEIRVCLLPLQELHKTIVRNHEKFIFPQGYSTVRASTEPSIHSMKVDPGLTNYAEEEEACELKVYPCINIDD